MTNPNFTGNLDLGYVLAAAGLDPAEVIVLRHTYSADGLIPGRLTPEAVLHYTRRQDLGNKLGKVPPRLWLSYMADGKRRSRLMVAYQNHSELPEHRSTSSASSTCGRPTRCRHCWTDW